jgi:tetratricopeptide (TPR) repeat protein
MCAFYMTSQGVNPMGLFEKAADDFAEAIKIDPGDFESYRMRGNTLLYLANWQRQAKADEKPILEAAEKDLSRAIELNSSDAEAYLLRATAFEMQGNYSKARADLKRAAEINPAFKPDVDRVLKKFPPDGRRE